MLEVCLQAVRERGTVLSGEVKPDGPAARLPPWSVSGRVGLLPLPVLRFCSQPSLARRRGAPPVFKLV